MHRAADTTLIIINSVRNKYDNKNYYEINGSLVYPLHNRKKDSTIWRNPYSNNNTKEKYVDIKITMLY